MKSISILTPIYNNEKILDLFFQQIEKQNIPENTNRIEFLICNDGSNVQALNLINTYSHQIANKFSVRVFHNTENMGWRYSLDKLLKNSTGDVVVFIDSDSIANDENWLKEITKDLINDSVEVVQGDFWSQLDNNYWSKQHARWRKAVSLSRFMNKDGTLNTVNTRNLAVKRSVIKNVEERTGGVLNQTAILEGSDTTFGFEIRKLGISIHLSYSAIVKHVDPINYFDIFKKKIKYGYSDGKIGIFYRNNFYYSVYIPYKDEKVSLIFSLPITIGFSVANIIGYLKYKIHLLI